MQNAHVLPGDLGLISQQEVSGNRWEGGHRLLSIGIDDEIFQGVLEEELAGRRAQFDITPHTTDDILRRLLLSLIREVQLGYPSGRLFGESAILAIVRHALPRYGTVRPVVKQYHRGLGTVPLRRVLEYIDDCMGQNLGVRELASITGMSQYHFARLFRNSMGRNVHQYLLERRMDAACRLVDAGKLTLAAIGAAVGFSNPSQFSTAFRRRLGLTPREYQALQRPSKSPFL